MTTSQRQIPNKAEASAMVRRRAGPCQDLLPAEAVALHHSGEGTLGNPLAGGSRLPQRGLRALQGGVVSLAHTCGPFQVCAAGIQDRMPQASVWKAATRQSPLPAKQQANLALRVHRARYRSAQLSIRSPLAPSPFVRGPSDCYSLTESLRKTTRLRALVPGRAGGRRTRG